MVEYDKIFIFFNLIYFGEELSDPNVSGFLLPLRILLETRAV